MILLQHFLKKIQNKCCSKFCSPCVFFLTTCSFINYPYLPHQPSKLTFFLSGHLATIYLSFEVANRKICSPKYYNLLISSKSMNKIYCKIFPWKNPMKKTKEQLIFHSEPITYRADFSSDDNLLECSRAIL